ncbi:hypothetical protein, partial [Bacillus cereus]|uniref:hypothetical protein n=1 Tax=Bacillus cereus TaxID=1396 RepID=UPI0023660D1C
IALHLTKKGLVEGYFSKFYYFMLFLFAKIKKDSRVLGTLKGFPTLWTPFIKALFFVLFFITYL